MEVRRAWMRGGRLGLESGFPLGVRPELPFEVEVEVESGVLEG